MNHVFHVETMTCEHCEATVKKSILRLDRAAQVRIDRPAGRVEVSSTQDAETLSQAIAEEGFSVSLA